MPPTSIVRVAYITNYQLKHSNEQPFSQLSTPFVLRVCRIFTGWPSLTVDPEGMAKNDLLGWLRGQAWSDSSL